MTKDTNKKVDKQRVKVVNTAVKETWGKDVLKTQPKKIRKMFFECLGFLSVAKLLAGTQTLPISTPQDEINEMVRNGIHFGLIEVDVTGGVSSTEENFSFRVTLTPKFLAFYIRLVELKAKMEDKAKTKEVTVAKVSISEG